MTDDSSIDEKSCYKYLISFFLGEGVRKESAINSLRENEKNLRYSNIFEFFPFNNLYLFLDLNHQLLYVIFEREN